jgi:hypothetical protein
MDEHKGKPMNSNAHSKRSLTNSKCDETSQSQKNSPTKRARIEYEQTGYNRSLVPEMLMGATDIYDGELMFL